MLLPNVLTCACSAALPLFHSLSSPVSLRESVCMPCLPALPVLLVCLQPHHAAHVVVLHFNSFTSVTLLQLQQQQQLSSDELLHKDL